MAATHRSLSEQTRQGFFQYEFVEKLSDDYTCAICLEAVIGARQTSCCGHHLCQFCGETIAAKNAPCPICRQENMVSVPDLYFRRKLNELIIYCTHKSRGCPWTGELGGLEDHCGSCEYELVVCCHGCSQRVERRMEEQHGSTCPKRPYSCEYCSYKDTYKVVTVEHWPVCEKHPVDCPNRCDQKIIRSDLETHLKSACPLAEIECEFRYAGCNATLLRQSNDQHMTEHTQAHLSLLSAQLQQVLSILATKETELKTLRQEVHQLKELASTDKASAYQESGVFVLQNLKRYKDVHWCSPPFLSRPRGYKMAFKICCKAGNLQMLVYLIGGTYDDKLSWPFLGNIVVTVLNQLEKQEHDYAYKFNYRVGTPEQIAGRPELGQSNGDMPTSSRYLTLNDLELSHNGECQYLVNNCLRFRVTKIVTNQFQTVRAKSTSDDYMNMQYKF